MASVGPISESSIGITLGYLYFGLVFTSILWGVGCLQLYLYYESYWEYDRNWLKIYIFVTWVLDTLHQCLVMDETYSYFVKAIANPTIEGNITKSFIAIVAVSAFLMGMAHFIFIRRVWYVSHKNWAITGILATSSVALFAIVLVVFGHMCRFTGLAQLPSISHMLIGLNAIVGFTDTLISVVLIWLLWRTRSGIKRTDSIITRLIIYTVSSGLVTALWALMALIGAAVTPNSFLAFFADLVIPRLYFNCMLASLNVRSSLRATPLTSGVSVNFSNFAVASGVSSSTDAGSSHKATYNRPTVLMFKSRCTQVPSATALECRIDIEVACRSDSQFPDQKVASSDENEMHRS